MPYNFKGAIQKLSIPEIADHIWSTVDLNQVGNFIDLESARKDGLSDEEIRQIGRQDFSDSSSLAAISTKYKPFQQTGIQNSNVAPEMQQLPREQAATDILPQIKPETLSPQTGFVAPGQKATLDLGEVAKSLWGGTVSLGTNVLRAGSKIPAPAIDISQAEPGIGIPSGVPKAQTEALYNRTFNKKDFYSPKTSIEEREAMVNKNSLERIADSLEEKFMPKMKPTDLKKDPVQTMANAAANTLPLMAFQSGLSLIPVAGAPLAAGTMMLSEAGNFMKSSDELVKNYSAQLGPEAATPAGREKIAAMKYELSKAAPLYGILSGSAEYAGNSIFLMGGIGGKLGGKLENAAAKKAWETGRKLLSKFKGTKYEKLIGEASAIIGESGTETLQQGIQNVLTQAALNQVKKQYKDFEPNYQKPSLTETAITTLGSTAFLRGGAHGASQLAQNLSETPAQVPATPAQETAPIPIEPTPIAEPVAEKPAPEAGKAPVESKAAQGAQLLAVREAYMKEPLTEEETHDLIFSVSKQAVSEGMSAKEALNLATEKVTTATTETNRSVQEQLGLGPFAGMAQKTEQAPARARDFEKEAADLDAKIAESSKKVIGKGATPDDFTSHQELLSSREALEQEKTATAPAPVSEIPIEPLKAKTGITDKLDVRELKLSEQDPEWEANQRQESANVNKALRPGETESQRKLRLDKLPPGRNLLIRAMAESDADDAGVFLDEDTPEQHQEKLKPFVEENTKLVGSIDDGMARRLSKAFGTDMLTRLPTRIVAYTDGVADENGKILDGFTQIQTDLDNLKGINVGHGYRSGDSAIKRYAKFLKNTIGDLGKVYRMGGEELTTVVYDPKNLQIVLDKIGEARSSLGKEIFNEGKLKDVNFTAGVGTTDAEAEANLKHGKEKLSKGITVVTGKSGAKEIYGKAIPLEVSKPTDTGTNAVSQGLGQGRRGRIGEVKAGTGKNRQEVRSESKAPEVAVEKPPATPAVTETDPIKVLQDQNNAIRAKVSEEGRNITRAEKSTINKNNHAIDGLRKKAAAKETIKKIVPESPAQKKKKAPKAEVVPEKPVETPPQVQEKPPEAPAEPTVAKREEVKEEAPAEVGMTPSRELTEVQAQIKKLSGKSKVRGLTSNEKSMLKDLYDRKRELGTGLKRNPWTEKQTNVEQIARQEAEALNKNQKRGEKLTGKKKEKFVEERVSLVRPDAKDSPEKAAAKRKLVVAMDKLSKIKRGIEGAAKSAKRIGTVKLEKLTAPEATYQEFDVAQQAGKVTSAIMKREVIRRNLLRRKNSLIEQIKTEKFLSPEEMKKLTYKPSDTPEWSDEDKMTGAAMVEVARDLEEEYAEVEDQEQKDEICARMNDLFAQIKEIGDKYGKKETAPAEEKSPEPAPVKKEKRGLVEKDEEITPAPKKPVGPGEIARRKREDPYRKEINAKIMEGLSEDLRKGLTIRDPEEGELQPGQDAFIRQTDKGKVEVVVRRGMGAEDYQRTLLKEIYTHYTPSVVLKSQPKLAERLDALWEKNRDSAMAKHIDKVYTKFGAFEGMVANEKERILKEEWLSESLDPNSKFAGTDKTIGDKIKETVLAILKKFGIGGDIDTVDIFLEDLRDAMGVKQELRQKVFLDEFKRFSINEGVDSKRLALNVLSGDVLAEHLKEISVLSRLHTYLNAEQLFQRAKIGIAIKKEAMKNLTAEQKKEVSKDIDLMNMSASALAGMKTEELKILKSTIRMQGETAQNIRNSIFNYAKSQGIEVGTRTTKFRALSNNNLDYILKNAKTPRDFYKAIERIDDFLKTREKSELVKKVTETFGDEFKRIKKAQIGKRPGNELDQDLFDYMSGFLVSASSRAKLRQGMIGAIVNDPNHVLSREDELNIQTALKKDIRSLSNEQLNNVLATIHGMKKAGSAYSRMKKLMTKEQIQKKASELAFGINSKIGRMPPESFERSASDLQPSWLKDKATSFMSPEAIIETMFDNNEWNGPMKKAIFDPANEAVTADQELYDKWLKMVQKILANNGVKPIKSASLKKPMMTIQVPVFAATKNDADPKVQIGSKEIPLSYENGMFVYAHSKNEISRNHLLSTFDPETGAKDIENIIRALPENYKKAVDNIKDFYSKEVYPKMNEIFRAYWNVDLPQEWEYFPISWLASKNAKLENTKLADAMMQIGSEGGYLQRGATFGRNEKADSPFAKMEFYSTVLRSVRENTHWITHEPMRRSVQPLLDNLVLKAAMEQESPSAAKQLSNWFDDVLTGRIAPSSWDAIRTNPMVALIGFNIISVLKSPVSLVQAAAKHPVYTAKALAMFAHNPKEFHNFVKDNSPLVRNTNNSFSREIVELEEKKQLTDFMGARNTAKAVREFSLAGMRAFDKLTRDLTWMAGYQNSLNAKSSRGDVEKAKKYGDWMVRRTQMSGRLIDVSDAKRRNTVIRAITPFTEQSAKNSMLLLQNGIELKKDIKAIFGGDFSAERMIGTADDIREFGMLTMLSPAIMQLIGTGAMFQGVSHLLSAYASDDEEERRRHLKEARTALMRPILNWEETFDYMLDDLLSHVPLASQFMGVLAKKAVFDRTREARGMEPLREGRSSGVLVLESAENLMKGIAQENLALAAEGIARGLGGIFGIPGPTQAIRTIKGIREFKERKEKGDHPYLALMYSGTMLTPLDRKNSLLKAIKNPNDQKNQVLFFKGWSLMTPEERSEFKKEAKKGLSGEEKSKVEDVVTKMWTDFGNSEIYAQKVEELSKDYELKKSNTTWDYEKENINKELENKKKELRSDYEAAKEIKTLIKSGDFLKQTLGRLKRL